MNDELEQSLRVQNLSTLYEQSLREIAAWRRRAVVAEEERGLLLDRLQRLIDDIEGSLLEQQPMVQAHLVEARRTIGGLSRKRLN